jgi:small subunit ribosomal protein S5
MEAVTQAQADAQKRMISVSRWHEALPHTIISKYRGTKVIMMAGRPGKGVSGHPTLQILADAFGLKDITCKTFRSRNTRKIVAAFVHGIIKNAKFVF